MALEVEPRFIKHGVWTNLDQGPVLGQTITTDTKTGNLIVALLAVLSTLGTSLDMSMSTYDLTSPSYRTLVASRHVSCSSNTSQRKPQRCPLPTTASPFAHATHT